MIRDRLVVIGLDLLGIALANLAQIGQYERLFAYRKAFEGTRNRGCLEDVIQGCLGRSLMPRRLLYQAATFLSR